MDDVAANGRLTAGSQRDLRTAVSRDTSYVRELARGDRCCVVERAIAKPTLISGNCSCQSYMSTVQYSFPSHALSGSSLSNDRRCHHVRVELSGFTFRYDLMPDIALAARLLILE